MVFCQHYRNHLYREVKIACKILIKFYAFTSFILQKSGLECLRNVYESDSANEVCVTESERNNITNMVVDLWQSLSEDALIKYDLLQAVLTSIIHVTGSVINSLDSCQICKMSLLIVSVCTCFKDNIVCTPRRPLFWCS